MIKKILSFFYTDLHWKLISLGLAIIIWFVAMHLHDPLENRPHSTNLRVHNHEILVNENLVLVNEAELLGTSISLSVRGHRSSFGQVSMDDFIVYVDMRSVNIARVRDSEGPITERLPVNVNLMPGFEFQSVRTAFVDVELDIRERRTFPVRAEGIGQVSEGLELQELQVINPNVAVTAAREVMNTIDHLRVEVDLTNMGIGDEVDASIRVINHNNEDITRDVLTLSVSQTTVRPVFLSVQAMELRVEPIGEMAPGFIISEIRVSEFTIDVVGTPEQLSTTEYILLQFDPDGLAGSDEIYVDVIDFIPEGLALSQNAPTEIMVIVTVEPIQTRNIIVPWRDVFVTDGGALYQAINAPLSVRVAISGPQSRVGAMTANDLTVAFDLRNRPVGIQMVSLNIINLPEGVSLAEPLQSVEIQIFEPATVAPEDPVEPIPSPTPTPEPTPAPTPTPTPIPTPTPEPTPPPDENGNGENGNGDDPYDPNGDDDPDPYDENGED
ncbi:MAG: CdaR family protein [Defluviitaleaceae bacterium]|nr:CdaR family protein [Defluviitaleaceae bacterium]